MRELEERRAAIVESIDSQGAALTEELKAKIESAEDKTTLEDLYLPYKPKRRTKAMIAREAGLEPLADALLANRCSRRRMRPRSYLSAEPGRRERYRRSRRGLRWKKQILMERLAEDAALLARVREHLSQHGVVVSAVVAGQGNRPARNFPTISIFRDVENHSLASRARDVPGPQRRRAHGEALGRYRGRVKKKPSWSAPFNAFETLIATKAGVTNKTARRTNGSRKWCAGRGASRSPCTWKQNSWARCARRRKSKRSISSPRT